MRFSEDDITPKDKVYLDEETARGTETPLERVLGAVWGMSYTFIYFAHDAAVISRPLYGSARRMTVFVCSMHFGACLWTVGVGEEGRGPTDTGTREIAT